MQCSRVSVFRKSDDTRMILVQYSYISSGQTCKYRHQGSRGAVLSCSALIISACCLRRRLMMLLPHSYSDDDSMIHACCGHAAGSRRRHHQYI